MFSFANANTLIGAGKALVSIPAMVYSTGLPAIFNTSLFDAAINAAIVGTSICYSAKINKDHQFSAQHVKVALGMITSLQNSYSSIKLISNIGSVINSAWNGKVNIKDNMDFSNAFKFAGFALNGVSTLSSLKTSALGITTVFGEDSILKAIDSNLPFGLNYLAKNAVSNILSTDGSSSIKAFNSMFKDLLPYFDTSNVLTDVQISDSDLENGFVDIAIKEITKYENPLQQIVHESLSFASQMLTPTISSVDDWVQVSSSSFISQTQSLSSELLGDFGDWVSVVNSGIVQ